MMANPGMGGGMQGQQGMYGHGMQGQQGGMQGQQGMYQKKLKKERLV